jgi:hypothetical protein
LLGSAVPAFNRNRKSAEKLWSNQMSDESNKYLMAAKSFGQTRKERNFLAGNRFADELQNLGQQMRSTPDGQACLLDMLSDEDPYVRSWAAKDCLFFSPERAIPVLESLSRSGGLLSLSATVTLDEWRVGRLA